MYNYSPQKHKPLFIQNSLRVKSNKNNPVNSITKMPRSKTNKATPTGARVTFSDTTPSNITTKSNNKNLHLKKIIQHYLDEDTIPGGSYLTEEQWADTALCSDTEIEKEIIAANNRAQKSKTK